MKRLRWMGPLVVVLLVAAGCSSDDAADDTAVCDGEVTASTIEAWAHEGAEADAYKAMVDDFNATVGADAGVTVNLTLVPEGDYTDKINAAAAAGDLPDLLDFDGPTLANYAWAGSLVSIDGCISDDLRDNTLSSIIAQGTYNDTLYSVGSFDSGLGMYAWRSALEGVGAEIPTEPSDAWNVEEFTQILRDLQAAGFEHPLDYKPWYGTQGEWMTYGFSPIIQSGGGDLIDRDGYQTADGFLNSEDSVNALTTFQGWVTEGLTDNDAVDDSNFISGSTPLSWVGHWMYNPYKEAVGDDLVIVPLPDFGKGTRTGMGSWAWGITSAGAATDGDAAWMFIDFAMTDDSILKITESNGAVPATQTAIDKSPNFADGGPLDLFVKQLQGAPDVATPRPVYPGYPTLTAEYWGAMDKIILGADVQETLDAAVAAVDADIEANDGYPAP